MVSNLGLPLYVKNRALYSYIYLSFFTVSLYRFSLRWVQLSFAFVVVLSCLTTLYARLYCLCVRYFLYRLLAFVACPMFGRLSDVIGRRKCLFVTVLGTASPVVALCVSSNLWAFAAAAAFSGEISEGRLYPILSITIRSNEPWII